MTNIAEILRLLNNLIRLGSIAEIDPKAVRVRVQTGDNLTDWVPWLTLRAGTTGVWDPPTVGEQVILFSPAGDLSQAIALAGIPTDSNPAPADSLDLYRRLFPDGTSVTYDHAGHILMIQVKGDAQLTIEGNCTAQIEGNLSATVGGTVEVTAGGEATVDAPAIRLNGGAGVVTGAHICQMTGKPHSHCSTTVFAGE